MTVREVVQLELFVKDEETAIRWLRQRFTKKPETFQEVHPHFMKELGGWEKHERSLELAELWSRTSSSTTAPAMFQSGAQLPLQQLQGAARP